MRTTPRLALQIPDGTDEEETFPTEDAATLAILDAAALFNSGTLSGRPSATTVAPGYFYACTDVQAHFVTVSSTGLSTGNTWQYVPVGGGTVPVGTVVDFAGSSIPADADGVTRWHLADGSMLSRTTYAVLYSAIGTSWGSGDGSTTFNVPDFRGRTTIGAGSGSGLTTRTVAQSGGEETHQLSSSESGVNGNGSTGTGSTGGGTTGNMNANNPHTHSELVGLDGANSGPYGGWGADNYSSTLTNAYTVGATDISHGHSVPSLSVPSLGLNARTADSAHNNLQPFSVTSKAIRIL